MTEVLSGDTLVAQLSADHQATVRFMKVAHDVMAPVYLEWKEDHDWKEVDIPESVSIPPLWKSLQRPNTEAPRYHRLEADAYIYEEACRQYGLDERTLDDLWLTGLDSALHNAEHSLLFNCSSDDLVFKDEHHVHYATSSLFASQRLVVADGEDYGTDMGEITITNVGEGDIGGYTKLQVARLRAQKVVSTIFRSTLAQIGEEFSGETSGLSRALCARDTEGDYNPLLHTAIEGMMGVGQAVNILIQPGIEGARDVPVTTLAKSVLSRQLPFTVSKIFLNGDLGPEQMAGLAIDGLTVISPEGVDLRPEVVQTYLARKADRKARTVQLEDGDELSLMQRPEARAVNRGSGCPAGAAVRLMSKMLLDALEASDQY